MSSREKQAKICLLSLQTQEFQEHYDPYRLQNTLKQCQTSLQYRDISQPRIRKTSLKTLSKNNIERQNKKTILPNNRQSLKKLLRKLQEMPSPEKKMNKVSKTKTLGEIPQKKQPLLQIKQCFHLESTKKEQKKIKSIINEDQQIRKLIKKKMLLKRQSQNSHKIQKITKFLRQNHKIKPLSRRNSFYRKGSESKKLLNILF